MFSLEKVPRWLFNSQRGLTKKIRRNFLVVPVKEMTRGNSFKLKEHRLR